MFANEDTARVLATLGARLRAARIEKGDSQALFAQRLGVSIPTLQDMERGLPRAAIGSWAAALWMLSRVSDLDRVLEAGESLFDQRRRKPRQRAPRAGREPEASG